MPACFVIMPFAEKNEERLRKIAEARAKIEARARERHAREMAEHEAKMAARAAKTAATGKKPGGRPPQPPTEGPLPSDQVNLTDEDSRIMPVAGGGFDQCYNAQAAVAVGSLLVVATDVVQAPNDKNQVEPMLGEIGALPETLGEAETLLADTGYFSAGNVEACEKAGIEPAIAMGRQPHHPPLAERFEKAPAAPENPTPVEAMAHRLRTPRRPGALRPAQTDAGTGVRHHQIRARIPSIFTARARKSARRVEPGDHGLEHEANVRPRPRLLRAGRPRAQRLSRSIAGPTGSTGAPTKPDWASTTAAKRKNPFEAQPQELSPTGC